MDACRFQLNTVATETDLYMLTNIPPEYDFEQENIPGVLPYLSK
jgi:hypothetical protein